MDVFLDGVPTHHRLHPIRPELIESGTPCMQLCQRPCETIWVYKVRGHGASEVIESAHIHEAMEG